MLFNIRYLNLVAFLDVYILLLLFPTPVRLFISKFIDISDGSGLIDFSFFVLAINILLVIWWGFDRLRGTFLKDKVNWLFYASLCVVFLYITTGVTALYQMYVVGLT